MADVRERVRAVGTGPVLVLVGFAQDRSPSGPALERVRHLASAARSAGVRVVHLMPASAVGREVIAQSGLESDDTEHIVEDRRGDAEDQSRLQAVLGPATRSLAIAGDPVDPLVQALARDASARGVPVIVLEDTSDRADDEEHEAALTGPLASVATIVDSDSWLAGIRGRRRSRRARLVLGVAAVVIVALLVSGFVWARDRARGYYLLSPGSAPVLTVSSACQPRSSGSGDLALANGQPCALIQVPAPRYHPIEGSLYMVDVLEGPATTSDYLLDRLGLLTTFHQGSQLDPASAILGTTPVNQVSCQDTQEMAQATQDAPVAALRHLGYDVKERDLGAQIDLVMPGFPASQAGLACNDIVTAVNGHPVTTVQQAAAVLAGFHPGTTVQVTAASTASGGKVVTRTVPVHLTSTPSENGAPAQADKAFLGVELETRSIYSLPFNVSINVGNIGGPSAGLALTLGLIDVLSSGRLTGGHKVAATGTIDPTGAVGPIGGLPQKAVAIRNAGAQIFFVPDPVTRQDVTDLATARREVGAKVHIYPVASLSQALGILRQYGGKIPAPAHS